MRYYTKASLYSTVHKCKNYFGYSEHDISINLIQTCNEAGINVGEADFSTKGLRGIAFIGNNSIVLNKRRDRIEQNFDCCHELFHLYMHSNLKRDAFQCFDKLYPIQDKFIEWQANEGAAEFFVPYKTLLQIIKARYHEFTSSHAIIQFKYELADLFSVSLKVIEYRLESLKYEVNQYLNGVELSNIDILSASQQKKQHIKVNSLNDTEADLLMREYAPTQESRLINFNTIFI